ncbi:MAG: single-stranded-DNA-specific exonuclease RecJ [Gammaproteobacteria bacterium]
MEKRIVRRVIPAADGLMSGLRPVFQRIYLARGVRSSEELDYSLTRLLPYRELGGITQAVEVLAGALERAERIVVVGDFDADGATGCALAVRGLRALGAADVHYVVPNRFEYGYGLTPEIVAITLPCRPQVLVTVDNGISSIDGVAAARRAGVRVVITDHHLPGPALPEADAIVNPNRPGDLFPSKVLCGVGVMFYVLTALRAHLRASNWFAGKGIPNLASFLDLVALGTVADVVPLDHNNRILVTQGLARIRAGRCVPGIRALVSAAGRDLGRLSARDLGFAVAPRLNAAGRLADMRLGIECLLAEDEGTAKELASRLDGLNRERRDIEAKMHEEAIGSLAGVGSGEINEAAYGVCLFHEDWHQGVVGIVAGRIRERINRPVIAFALASGDEIKGSARSVAGVHVRDTLDAVAAAHPGLISKFGGHAMAAGMVLRRADLAAFARAFDLEVERRMSPETLRDVVYTDGELGASDLGLEMAEALEHAGPWGQGFPEPLFDGEFDLQAPRVVADRHLKFILRPDRSTHSIAGIAFNAVEAGWTLEARRVRLAYRLAINEYQGRSPQLIVEHALPLP